MLKKLQRATLEFQGLSHNNHFGKGEKAVLSCIEQLGYVQIDTLSVVERAHHHILWSRIPDYQPDYLQKLVDKKKVFEYWFHAASYLPMKDYRFALPQMSYFKRGESPYYNDVELKVLNRVLDKIRSEGPQKARDFKSPKHNGKGWWDVKPTKLALAKLFMQGDIMVTQREGMEKTFDIAERVLPNSVNTSEPSSMELAEYLTNTYLRAYGSTTIKQITHLRTGKKLKENVKMVLNAKLDSNLIQEVHIPGLPTFYVLNSVLEKDFKKPAQNIKILSPFDNSVIHRDRLKQLFNFDFKLECYVTKTKRLFGYFCLPILLGNEFVGRVDCKAHRKTRQFEIIHLHIEKRHKDAEIWLASLTESIKKFAKFNGCASILLSQVSPKEFTSTFKKAFIQ